MVSKYGPLDKGDVLLVSWQRKLMGGNSQVYLLDHNSHHSITANTGFEYFAGYWAADPQTCFVSTQYGNTGHLYLYHVDGSRIRELASNGRVKNSLLLSPNRRYLSYWSHPVENGGGLIIFDWKNDYRTVIQDTTRLIDKYWAADSKSLVGIGLANDDMPMWFRYGLDGRELDSRPLPHLKDMYELTLSPDGEHIAYVQHDDAEEILLLMLSRLDGSGVHHLGRLNDMESPPVWSPDGERLAWVGTKDEARPNDSFWLFVTGKNGSNIRALTPLDEADDSGEIYPGHPTWSPDGRKIAISSFVDNSTGDIKDGTNAGASVFVADVNSGEVKQVSDAAGVIFRVEWQPEYDTP